MKTALVFSQCEAIFLITRFWLINTQVNKHQTQIIIFFYGGFVENEIKLKLYRLCINSPQFNSGHQKARQGQKGVSFPPLSNRLK